MGHLAGARACAATVALVGLLAATACSGSTGDQDASDIPSVGESPATSPSPSPTSSPSPSTSATASPTTDQSASAPTSPEPPKATLPTATSYPEVGLRFTELPDVSGRRAKAVATFTRFMRLVRQSTREVKLAPALKQVALTSEVKTYRQTVHYLRNHNQHYVGSATLTMRFGKGPGRGVTLTGCFDGTGMHLEGKGGTEDLEGPPRQTYNAHLLPIGKQWEVAGFDVTGETC